MGVDSDDESTDASAAAAIGKIADEALRRAKRALEAKTRECDALRREVDETKAKLDESRANAVAASAASNDALVRALLATTEGRDAASPSGSRGERRRRAAGERSGTSAEARGDRAWRRWWPASDPCPCRRVSSVLVGEPVASGAFERARGIAGASCYGSLTLFLMIR